MEERTVIQTSVVGSVRPGTQLNRVYEIEKLIANGGMGEVYRGFNILTRDPVAIKLIRPEFGSDPEIIELFRREASALNKLTHEAIVRYFVFSVDPDLGRAYLAMEYVDGPSLTMRMTAGPMPLADLRILQKRIASALDVSHRSGIVHRDISPDNIILPNGDVRRAKIIDFGIARSLQAADVSIIGGRFAGKYNFASPEQFGMAGGVVTPKSDIYSFGLVLAAAARGRPIDMSGSEADAIAKRSVVPDLADVDPAFRPLLEGMLQPLPANRPASMAAVAAWEPPAGKAAGFAARRRTTATGESSGSRAAAVIGAAVALAALGSLAVVFRGDLARVTQSVVSPTPPATPELPPIAATPSARPESPPGVTASVSSPAASQPDGAGAANPATTASKPPTADDLVAALPPASPEPRAQTAPAPATPVPAPPAQPGAAPRDSESSRPEPAAAPSETAPVPDRETSAGPPSAPPKAGASSHEAALTVPSSGLGASASERARAFVAGFDGGDCFFITRAGAEGGEERYLGLGRTAEPFVRFDAGYKAAVGAEAAIRLGQIAPAQCPALDLVRLGGTGGATEPLVELQEENLGRGRPLAGRISNLAGRRLYLLHVDSDGVVHPLSATTEPGGDSATFSAPVRPQRGSPDTVQLLLAIASPTPIPVLDAGHIEPLKAIAVRLVDEARRASASVAADTFKFVD